jgi:hypothetical protein
MTTTCSFCHTRSNGSVVVAVEDDYDRLRALLAGALAADPCPACNRRLTTEPAVIVVFREAATVLYTPGTLMTDPDALAGQHLRPYLPPGVVPHLIRCPGQDRLCNEVRVRLAERLAPVRQFLEAAVRGEQWPHLADHWAEFPPPVVTAAGLAATCPGGPLELGVTGAEAGRAMGLDALLDRSSYGDEEAERAVAALQIRVWQALAADWSAGTRTGPLFADLDTYVSVAPVPAAGADLVPEIFADRPGDLYVLAAVRAAAALAAGIPNPHATTWAELYFGVEIARRRRPDDPHLRERAVPGSFAAATISQDGAWSAVRQSFHLLDDVATAEAAMIIQSIAEVAGHPGAPAAVLQAEARSRHEPATSAEEVADRATPLGDETPDPVVLAGADLELARVPGLLDDVAKLLLKRRPGAETPIRVWWATNALKLGRTDDADRVLGVVTTDGMDDATHARFLGARAAILAGRGHVDKATGRWREAETWATRAGDVRLRYWTRVNLAIRLQETDPDQALEILLDAAYGPDRYGGDHAIFGLMAGLRERRGEIQAAIELLALAERHSTGEVAERYAARRRILQSGDRKTDGGSPDEAERALRAGDRAEFLRLTLERAVRLHNAGDPSAAAVWEQLVRQRADYGFPDDPQELAEAAHGRLRAGDPDGMRDLLARLPRALARRYGNAPANVAEPRSLMRPLVLTAGLLTEADRVNAADLRLAGELQRDAVGRAMAARRHTALTDGAVEEPVWFGVPDPAIAATGPVAVVEWIQTGDQHLRCLLTRVGGDRGGDGAWWLTQVMDPVPVRVRLLERLDGYGPSRTGDPLDDPDWQAIAGHLVAQLGAYLHEGDHVVFLHHTAVANLPWHTAIRERWTVSYAASWTHLNDIVRRPPAARDRLGLCLVPQAAEDAEALAALTAAHDRLAALDDGTVTTGEPAANDAARLTRLLAEQDTVVLLGHGYHSDDQQDVGFMLAADGALPPADLVLRRRPQHLFLRADAAALRRTAPALFTPACSAARGYGAGLGDRLGLAAAFRHGGTVAMVAPVWKVRAAVTTPILTAAVELYLRGEPLARALRSAASAAAGTGPDWLVWALALDGDWR